jgi:hypothetical protein
MTAGKRYESVSDMVHDLADADDPTFAAQLDRELLKDTTAELSALRSRVEELEAALRRALSVVEDAAIERMREDGYAPHESEEPCTCYDEVDGAPDGPPPGRCLCCRIRAALSPESR